MATPPLASLSQKPWDKSVRGKGKSAQRRLCATESLYDTGNRAGSLQQAKAQIDALALEASAQASGEFLIQLTGVIDDPFM